jgi:hypothetical protein
MSAQLSRAVRRRFVARWNRVLGYELGRFESAHDLAAFVATLRTALAESPQAAYSLVRTRLHGPQLSDALLAGPDPDALDRELEVWLGRHYRGPKETP